MQRENNELNQGASLDSQVPVKKRIDWIDVSRGIAFLMVIYRHLGDYKNDSIMRYFMPVFLSIFFFVSGYLFKEKQSFLKVFEQRTRTLFLPFLILGTVVIVMSQLCSFKDGLTWVESFKGLLFQNHKNQLLWFIAALYLYSLIFYWIERFCKSDWTLLIVSVLLYIGNGVYNYCLGMPSYTSVWHIGMMGYSCYFMGLGKLYKKHENKIKLNNKLFWVLTVVYFAFIAMTTRKYSFMGSPMIIDCMFITTLGTLLLIHVCKNWKFIMHNTFLKFVGANTLFYFAFHGKVYAVLIKGTNWILNVLGLLHNDAAVTIMGFVLVFIDALVLIPITMIINKYLSFALGKGFKLYNCK